MRLLPALLLLAGLASASACRLTTDADADALAAQPVAATDTSEADPVLDPNAVDPYGRPLPLGDYDALIAAVDTATASGAVEVFPGGGVYHGDEVPLDDGERWQALLPEGHGGHVLQSIRVGVETVYDEIVDPEAGPFTGRQVTTPSSEVIEDGWVEDSSVVLVRRPEAPFRDGPVPTAFAGSWAPTDGALHLDLDGVAHEVTFVSGPEAAPGVRPERILLLARDGGPPRPVTHHIDLDDGHMLLLWAGDLDRDGRLDLLLDQTSKYNSSTRTLYLSGAASGSAPVRRVAEHWTTGC